MKVFERGGIVALTKAGTETETGGLVLVQQFRMIDASARRARRIERAPTYITEEVRARLAALLD